MDDRVVSYAKAMKVFACWLLILTLAGCGRSHLLTVGSKNFTEQIVLGEIVAQHLENRLHEKVARKLDLGGTLLAQQALQNGQIDLYPEYTGTALTAVLKLPPSPDADAAAVLQTVRTEYARRWKLQWFDPLGFNNTFAMVIRGPDARAEHTETLSDAAHRKPGWRLGVGYEFLQRPDGLPGLLKTYHLPLVGNPKTMDLGLLYSALEQKQVDMAAASATDGMLSVLDVKVLRDDRNYFPPYQAAVIVRSEALEAHAGLRSALGELSGKLNDTTMRRLNHEVDGKHRPIADVARQWLASSLK
ncbi:MAG: glycine betaine ABC transporter substrate-binding protein [Bryobacteraceae bacterium]